MTKWEESDQVIVKIIVFLVGFLIPWIFLMIIYVGERNKKIGEKVMEGIAVSLKFVQSVIFFFLSLLFFFIYFVLSNKINTLLGALLLILSWFATEKIYEFIVDSSSENELTMNDKKICYLSALVGMFLTYPTFQWLNWGGYPDWSLSSVSAAVLLGAYIPIDIFFSGKIKLYVIKNALNKDALNKCFKWFKDYIKNNPISLFVDVLGVISVPLFIFRNLKGMPQISYLINLGTCGMFVGIMIMVIMVCVKRKH